MVAAIRQLITVGEDGRIEVRSSQLRHGDVAEVIVLLNSSEPEPEANQPHRLTAALDQLQQSLKLSATTAAAWTELVRAERACKPDVLTRVAGQNR